MLIPVATPQPENKILAKQQMNKYLMVFIVKSLIRVGRNFYYGKIVKNNNEFQVLSANRIYVSVLRHNVEIILHSLDENLMK